MREFRVCSYNVRYASRDDHHDVWERRRDGVASLLRFHRPDVVGFQEPLPDQRADLRRRLDGYEFVGRGRLPDGDGEGCPVAVGGGWEVVESDTFWLSETPGESSKSWGASHPRVCTWARIRATDGGGGDEGGAGGDATPTVTLFNTHFDHVSARARREAATLLRERVAEIAGDDPAVVVGDLRDAVADADVRHGPHTSLTDFAELVHDRRIDHVLVSPDVEVAAAATLADRDSRGRYPSDHLPVLARLRL